MRAKTAAVINALAPTPAASPLAPMPGASPLASRPALALGAPVACAAVPIAPIALEGTDPRRRDPRHSAGYRRAWALRIQSFMREGGYST